VAAWWKALTARGGEGMVVKPLDFFLRAKRGLAQPALKCRGPEYLRIIYVGTTTPKGMCYDSGAGGWAVGQTVAGARRVRPLRL